MKRRDFLKAFSAGTTLVVATSLANIVEAEPVIQTLEKSVILPGDDDFDVDWIFNHIGIYEHKYDGGSQFYFGVLVSDNFVDVLKIFSGNDFFHFGFKLEEYYLKHSPPMSSNSPFPPHYLNFLENNVFVASTKDISLGGENGEGMIGLEINDAMIAW